MRRLWIFVGINSKSPEDKKERQGHHYRSSEERQTSVGRTFYQQIAGARHEHNSTVGQRDPYFKAAVCLGKAGSKA